jgi:ankyrin repeat protein
MNAIRPLVLLAQLVWCISIQAAPVHDAAFRGDLAAIRAMLAADSLVVHLRDSLGATPLHYAALGGHHGLVELLAGRNAVVDARDAYGSTPLHYAMRGGPRYPAIQGAFVRLDGLEAMYRPEDSLRPTAELPWNGVIVSLVGRRADVNARDGFGATPLHRAAGSGRFFLSRTLLGLAAEVNARDDNERTPLHWAVQAGNAQIVVLLLRDQADVNALDDEGRTPLHFAAMFNRWDVAQILIERGARVNERDEAGLTAREYAEREGDRTMVELLELRDGE